MRDLWVTPGLVSAEVVDKVEHHVSLRVKVLDDRTWARALKLLTADLSSIAALIEGELPDSVLKRFHDAGVPLLPSTDELDGLCECGDYAMPCAHMAAVHCVLASALDGEPFQLLTLRGRPREQVLSALRTAWGERTDKRSAPREEKAPAADWFASPRPLPAMSFTFKPDAGSAPGLRELGPPPGRAELERALLPLYNAGRKAALELALGDTHVDLAIEPDDADEDARTRAKPRRSHRNSRTRRPMPGASSSKAATPSPAAAPPTPQSSQGADLAEKIVDLLAEASEGVKSLAIADALDADRLVVRQELVELEGQGIVYRTGKTRGTRWWLG